jgi:hypothetical protein
LMSPAKVRDGVVTNSCIPLGFTQRLYQVTMCDVGLTGP